MPDRWTIGTCGECRWWEQFKRNWHTGQEKRDIPMNGECTNNEVGQLVYLHTMQAITEPNFGCRFWEEKVEDVPEG